jgi:hypothetical protein
MLSVTFNLNEINLLLVLQNVGTQREIQRRYPLLWLIRGSSIELSTYYMNHIENKEKIEQLNYAKDPQVPPT